MSSSEITCLLENDKCHWTGTSGFCCSGNCIQDINESYGRCEPQSTPSVPSTASTSAITDVTTYKTTPPSNFTNSSASTTPEPMQQPITLAISITGAVLLVLVTTFCVCWVYIRRRKVQEKISHFQYMGSQNFNGFAHENIDNLPFDKKWEIPESDFSVDMATQLGSGCFGLVVLGKVKGMTVAVKTVRNIAQSDQIRALMSEIKILQYIGVFENIVSLVGFNASNLGENGKAYIFLEYCPLGSLEKYLRKNKYRFRDNETVNEDDDQYEEYYSGYQTDIIVISGGVNASEIVIVPDDLLLWSLQITNAMKYLASIKVIHADLATRNVLLVKRNHVKITDFGLSRRLENYSNYVKTNQEPLPWRWMALESLQELSFSHQSDAWALAVLFWEIWTLGEIPYPELSWTPEFINALRNDVRPTKPAIASDELYELMLDCWKANPSLRPNFGEIYDRLFELKKDEN